MSSFRSFLYGADKLAWRQEHTQHTGEGGGGGGGGVTWLRHGPCNESFEAQSGSSLRLRRAPSHRCPCLGGEVLHTGAVLAAVVRSSGQEGADHWAGDLLLVESVAGPAGSDSTQTENRGTGGWVLPMCELGGLLRGVGEDRGHRGRDLRPCGGDSGAIPARVVLVALVDQVPVVAVGRTGPRDRRGHAGALVPCRALDTDCLASAARTDAVVGGWDQGQGQGRALACPRAWAGVGASTAVVGSTVGGAGAVAAAGEAGATDAVVVVMALGMEAAHRGLRRRHRQAACAVAAFGARPYHTAVGVGADLGAGAGAGSPSHRPATSVGVGGIGWAVADAAAAVVVGVSALRTGGDVIVVVMALVGAVWESGRASEAEVGGFLARAAWSEKTSN